MLQFYNTLSRKKETFRPLRKKQVGLYTCGPTVYNFAHIGNLRTYVFEDILERTLAGFGFRVKRVMNITDVGHLTNDSDAGEDKIEQEARKEKQDVLEIARKYTDAFLKDIEKLNIKIPKIIAPATKFVPQQQKLIQNLFENGLAYETGAAVYFDVTRYGFEKYLKLSRQPLEEKLTAARKEVVEDPGKKHPADFVVWFKLAGKFANHILQWDSPWGKGFPGWHIECSAIARHFLGQPFDIHTGGIDLIAPHHTNEIAQSAGAYGKPLARVWLHGEFLVVGGGKMAKSKGSFLTLQELEARGFPPLAYRFFILSAHYRVPLNFSWEAVEAAAHTLESLHKQVGRLMLGGGRGSAKRARRYEREFLAALGDDLNTPQALAVLHAVLRDSTLSAAARLALVKKFDRVFALSLIPTARARLCLPPAVRRVKRKYMAFRRNQQFIQSDALRKQVGALGYSIEDTPHGPFLWPKKR